MSVTEPQPEALVAALADRYGVPADHVLATRGSDEGIDLLTRVFCRAGQDAVLHCPPTFGMYKVAAQAQGADVVSVTRSRESGFALDAGLLVDALRADDRVRLVHLTSPNNPTGDRVSENLLQAVLFASQDRALVVVDEAYAEFCPGCSYADRITDFPNLVVLRTLSKAWGSAGLRCGAVLAQPEVIGLLRRIIAPYPLATPVVSLALRALQPDGVTRQEELVQAIARNKKRLVSLLEGRPFVRQLGPGEANFVRVQGDDAAELLQFSASRGVILRGFPGDAALRDCVRISVGSNADLDALETVLDAWEKEPS